MVQQLSGWQRALFMEKVMCFVWLLETGWALAIIASTVLPWLSALHGWPVNYDICYNYYDTLMYHLFTTNFTTLAGPDIISLMHN